MSATKCKQCGFRVRGAQHENGPHHNGPSWSARRDAQSRERKRKAAAARK